MSRTQHTNGRTVVAERSTTAPVETDEVRSLVATVRERLPTESTMLRMPNCDVAMSIVSRAYNRTTVETVDYDGSDVRLECRGRPAVGEQVLEVGTAGLGLELAADLGSVQR